MKVLEAVSSSELPPPQDLRRKCDVGELIRMVNETTLNFSELALQFGVTRERIRQLAWQHLGLTGKDRPKKERPVKSPSSRHPFIEAAMSRGIEVVVLGGRLVTANGKLCWLGTASPRRQQGLDYVQIHQPNTAADLIIWTLPEQKGFVILPDAFRPTGRSTIFSLRQFNRSAAYSKRHDWITFVNAWHYLKGERQ